MLTGQTILIVEEEFLIALDIQRVLETLNATQTVFARTPAEALDLRDGWRGFGLAIVEFRNDAPQTIALARGLSDAGTCLVLIASDVTLRDGVGQIPGAPVIIKPFLEDDLLDAIQRACAGGTG